MKVKIGEDWRIDSEPMNFVLKSKKVYEKGDFKGQEYFATEGYYNNFTSAVEAISNLMLIESEATTLAEVKQELIEIKNLINRELS